MTFLNPAILFGLAAASIPVIIHLLNLRKLKKIEFSTLSFLKELQKNKIRRIKFKQWLLLALRVMIIIFIVGAFARPTLEGVNIGGTTSAAKTTAIFILDDTFSMSVVNQNGSYFNQAKQAIKNLLYNFEDGDECGLILISGNHDFEIESPGAVELIKERLDEIPISDATGTINSALIRSSNIISESKNFNKEIYLLTDFQKGRLAFDENITDISEVLGEQVKLYTFDYSGRDVHNLSIDNLVAATKIFEINKPATFNVTASNHSKQTVDNLVVSLFIGGNRSTQKSINLLPLESKVIKMDGQVRTAGFVDVIAETEDDDIIQDNKRYSTIFIPNKISVLLLYDELGDDKFIKLALQVASSNNIEVHEKSIQTFNSIQLKNYNVIIFTSSLKQNNSNGLEKYLTNGGGLIIFPPSNSDLNDFRNTLAALSLPEPGEVVKISNEANPFNVVDKIDKEHPLLQNIFKDENKIEFDPPAVYKYYRLMTKGKGNSIITLLDGSSFLSEYKNEQSKILVFNISPILEWSDFPVKSIFAPLVYKSVIYLSAKDRGGLKYKAGEPLNINVSNRTLPVIKVDLPDQSEDVIQPDDGADYVTFRKTFVVGNYKFYSGANLLETASVNTDPVESVSDYMSENEFDDYLDKINFKGSHIRVDKQENPSTVILQARFGSELWRYSLLAALILALIEMAIARSAKKEMVETE